jgi:SNF2 family DNA or RNA helicase
MVGSGQYKHLMDYFKSIEGAYYNEGKYCWMIPKHFVDDLDRALGENTAWFNSIDEIKGISEVVLPQFDVTTKGLDDLKLDPFPFQLVGISFLHDIKQALLADEMGLGKTPQAIGAIHRLFREGKVRKALVICPSSLKYQWAQEIEKFTDHQGIVIDGDPRQREEQFSTWLHGYDYLFAITNYELVRNDIDLLKKLQYDAIVVDEVHRIKNWASKTSIAMKELDAPYKFGLTGTPVQNRPEELWNLMDFLNPAILGNWWAFRKRFVVTGEKFGKKNVVIGYKKLDELRKKVAPFMLRRMKKDVAPELPEMIINDYVVEMTAIQQGLEEQLRNDLQELLQEIQQWHESKPASPFDNDNEGDSAMHPKEGQSRGFLTMMLEVCDSPQLLLMSEANMPKAYAQGLVADKIKSPKLDELEEIAKDQLEAGATKIVIFTQFAQMQKLIVERLSKIGKCEVLNGTMKPFERQAAVDRFKYDEDVNFFVTTDAGNYGINLQFASVLVHVDLPWNPAIYDQRCGRIHRIGSAFKEVTIINLISRGGIDEQIQETLYKKRELSNQLIEKNDKEREAMNKLTAQLKDPTKKSKAKKVK